MSTGKDRRSGSCSVTYFIAASPWRRPRNGRRIRLGWTPTQQNGRNTRFSGTRELTVHGGERKGRTASQLSVAGHMRVDCLEARSPSSPVSNTGTE
jgi:hypothetical protein